MSHEETGKGNPRLIPRVALLNICECLYGKLTETEIDSIARMKTVGEFATLLKAVAGEGREKGEPLAEERGLRKGEIQHDRIGR